MSRFVKTISDNYINLDYIKKIYINGSDEKAKIIADAGNGTTYVLLEAPLKTCKNMIETFVY